MRGEEGEEGAGRGEGGERGKEKQQQTGCGVSVWCFFRLWLNVPAQENTYAPHRDICSDNCPLCHSETAFASPIDFLTQLQYVDTGPTIPGTVRITPGAR